MLRYVGLVFLSLALTATGLVFGSKMADRPVCLLLVDNNSRRLSIYDPSHARILPENRYFSPTHWLSEDGYRLVTQPHLDNALLYSMTLLPPEGEPILLEESVRMSRDGALAPRASWSPDMTRFAYIWENAERESYLTIFNIEDHSKQTASIRNEARVGGTLWIGEWSADGAFINLRVQANQPFLDFYGLWSVEAMRLIPLEVEDTLMNARSAWSSTGHQLAVLMQPVGEETFRLDIINPEDPENRILVPLNLSDAFVERVYAVAWSPNDAYVMVAKERTYRVDEGRTIIRQWFYDIYASDGTPVEVDIAGRLTFASSGERLFVPGFWSDDGHTWIFLQDMFQGAVVPTTRLMAYNLETGEYDLLEDDIISLFYARMFTRPNSFTSPTEVVVPANRHMLLPYWRDDTITLDYIDYENDTRITLIEGAKDLRLDFLSISFSPLDSVDAGFFVVPWGGDAELRLTVFSSDDGQILTEVTGIEDIRRANWLGNNWMSSVVLRDGVWGLELLNVKTGVHHRLLESLAGESAVLGTISPDEQQAALVVFLDGIQSSSESGSLYLVSLESGDAQLVHEAAVPYPVWSQDSSALAFMRPGANNLLGVQVVSASGTTIGDTDIPIEMRTGMRSIYGWSNCDSNPTWEWRGV